MLTKSTDHFFIQ